MGQTDHEGGDDGQHPEQDDDHGQPPGHDAGHGVDDGVDQQRDDAAGHDPAERAVSQLEGAGQGEPGDDRGHEEHSGAGGQPGAQDGCSRCRPLGPGLVRHPLSMASPRSAVGDPATIRGVRERRRRSCHHRRVDDDASALRVDPDEVAGARLRLRLDWRTFVWLTLAVVGALATLALFRNTTTMFTRIGIGVLIALALDPLVDRLQHRFKMRRGFAVAIVALGIIALAALLVLVLGPRAVAEARKFSDQLPETVDQLGKLPLVGRWIRDNDVADKVQDWVRNLPEQFTDERVAELASTLVSGIASVAMVAVLAIAVLIDGENLLERFRRLLPPARQQQADAIGNITYRTLGRYFGGSLTVAVLMGLWVLTLGLMLGVPLAPLAALWAMLTDLIPQVGGFLGGAFFVLLAVTQGVTPALIAAGGFILYMNLENHIIQPAIVGRSVDLTPPTTMVAAFVGGAIAGIPGALVATPFVGAVKVIYLEARGRAKPEEEVGGSVVGRLRNIFRRGDRHQPAADADPPS